MSFLPRSMLYIPATALHLLARATQRGADAIVLDLEDAIAPSEKARARSLLANSVTALQGRSPLLVRVNSNLALLTEDVMAALAAGCDGLVLPKVESAADVQHVAALITAHENAHPDAPAIVLQAIVETPRALLHLDEIIHASSRLTSLAFGGEDFATAMGVTPTPQALAMPAQAVAIAAVAAGLHPVGLAGTIGEYGDIAQFSELAQLSRALGMRGAACIHPAQLPALHAAFGADEEKIQQAREIVQAYEQALALGQGAVAIAGRMVDAPIAERARQWLRSVGEAP